MTPRTIAYLFLFILVVPMAIAPAHATVSRIYPTRDNVVNASTWGDFATVRSANGSGIGGNTDRVMVVSLNATTVPNQYRSMNRSILIFDTRSIPRTAYIHQVNLSLYHFTKYGGLGNNTGLSITAGVTGNPTTIYASDYQRANLSTAAVLAPDIPYSSFRTGGRFNFTWYSWATKPPYLNTSNYTQVYARLTWDTQNTMNGTWASNANTTIAFSSVDNSSTTYDPFLEVIWTAFPTATFVGTPVTGTVPLLVQFNHTGSCESCMVYNWSFGDGTWFNTTQTGNLRNASHFYNTSGRYTVNLSATNIAGTALYSRSNYVTAQDDPVINWTGNATTANLSTAVYFLDRSTGLNQNRWNWSFNRDSRDRNVSSSRNWSHKFPQTGWYTVNHSVTTNYGLSQALTRWDNRTDYIHIVNNTISGNFNGTPLSGSAPLTVSFVYTTTGGPEENYTWIFHQGSSISHLKNPTYTYETPGTYSVNHSACNDAGCVWVNRSNYITITASQPVASFTTDVNAGTQPFSVQFTDTSTNSPTSWWWAFGDGTTSTLQNPAHLYALAGDFTVSHSATNAGGTGAVNMTHRILSRNPAPAAGFTADPLVGNVTTSIQFTDTSSGTNVTGWSWGFGDGGTSQARNASHTYTSCTNASCTFTVSHGAVDSAGTPWNTPGWRNETAPFTIFGNLSLTVSFTGTPLEGSWPLGVSFTAVPAGGIGVDRWHWDFGEGNTSTLQNPAHVYEKQGTYQVALTATNFTLGKVVVVKPSYIFVKNKPCTADFTWDVSAGTRPLQVRFNDTSTNTPDSWFWDFGDGTTSTLRDPVKIYNAAGQFTVSHRAGNNGGSDWENKTALVTVRNPGPVAGFTAAPPAGNITTPIRFTDTSSGTNVTGWSWRFGDGATSQDRDPVHTYTSCGGESCTFTVNHSATDSAGAPWSTTGWRNETGPFTIYANLTPTVTFTGTPLTGAWPLEISFTATQAGGIRVDSWFWDFGDGNTSPLQDPVHVFQAPGTYGVVLTATNFTLGQDMVAKPGYITVKNQPPVAGFSRDVTAGTRPLEVRFTDTSTNNPDSWFWDFGDGTTSSLRDPVKTYDTAGQFTVSHRAGNDGGEGWENRTGLITVRNPAPAAGFTADPLLGNLSTPIRFSDASTGTNITGWLWDFGDGISSRDRNPAYTYPGTGYYTVSLTATDSEGTPWNVTGSFSRADYIRVVNNSISPDFSAAPVSGYVPLDVNFTDTSTGGPAENVTYWFGDGTSSTERDPVHAYLGTGTYSVNHSACNDAGCFWLNRSGYITITYPPPPPTPRYYIQIGGGGSGSQPASSMKAAAPAESSPEDSMEDTGGDTGSDTGEAQGTGAAQGAGSTGMASGSGTSGSGGGQGSGGAGSGTGSPAGRQSGVPDQGQSQPAPSGTLQSVVETLGDIVSIAGNLFGFLQDHLSILFGW